MAEAWGAAEDWQRAREGDARAFASLARELIPRVRAFLFRLGGFRGELDDLCQEVFVRLVQGLDRLRDPACARAFVLGIAVRVHRERIRRHDEDAVAVEPLDLSPRPEERVLGRERDERIRRALLGLPASLRDVLVLLVFEQLEPVEVAQVLGLSPGAVRHRSFRARGLLRESLADLWDPEESPR